ncbi:MAG: hypothetical protein GF320_17050 [Armatimonadia bacterium]|nr:hypothetical protein [Armatimonadia bacterium]
MSRAALAIALLACVLSGAAGLTYELLWLRWLSIPFGASARAAGLVLSAFFLGSALGARWVAPLADRLRYPLFLYAILEVGVGLGALLVPASRDWLAEAYRRGAESFGLGTGEASALVLGLAFLTMLPATVAMGATLPAMMRGAEDPARPGARAAAVYGANLVGALAGVGASGLWLIPSLGATRTLAWAMIASAVAAMLSLAVAPHAARRPAPPMERDSQRSAGMLLAIAAGSGGLFIALEVLWTRLLAQVLQNGVYTFASILLVALGGLAVGSWIAAVLLRTRRPEAVLSAVLALTGVAVLATPLAYASATGQEFVRAGATAMAYVLRVLTLSAAIIGPACVLGGLALPMVLGILEREAGARALVLGKALGWNAVAAAIAGIAAAELLLPALGLSRSIYLLAAGYGLLALCASWRLVVSGWSLPLAVAGALVFLAGVSLPMAGTASSDPRVLFERHTPSGLLRVMKSEGHRVLTLDGYYRLGGTKGAVLERRQMHLPLALHPGAERVACIGLATGITAGAATGYPVESLTVYEIVPEVAEASALFRPENRDVLCDPRTRLVPEDGRLALEAEDQRYDVIVCDLVLPWQESAGALYSEDFFEVVAHRLEPGGTFWLWLPMYQLAEREYAVIAHTFLRVFPAGRVFRGDDIPDRPILALVGGPDGVNLDQPLPRAADDPMLATPDDVLRYHAGRLRVPEGWDPPANTDDRPVLPYLAADSRRRRDTFTGDELMRYLESLPD